MTDQHAPRPLAFGQLSVWRVMETYPLERFSETYLRDHVAVPPGTTLDEAVRAVSVLCRRHESLRTLFVDSPEGPRQHVVPAEETVTVEVVEHDDAAVVAGRLARDRIVRADEFGRRFAVVTRDGLPHAVVIVVDHIVSDGYGMIRLMAELLALLGSPDEAGRRWLAETAPCPRDLAAEQWSEANGPRRKAVLRHWQKLLDTLPEEHFPVRLSDGDVPGRIEATLYSARARAALELLASHTNASPHTLLLSLSAVACGVVTGATQPVLTLQSGNRFDPRWNAIVSSMNQYVPLPVDLGAPEAEYTGFLSRLGASAFKAYRMGMYDFDGITDLVRRERQIELGFDHFFNFLPTDIVARPSARLDGHPPPRVETTTPRRQIGPRFDIKVRFGAEMPIVIRADPRLLPAPQLRSLAGWFDEQLCRLADGTDTTVRQVAKRCATAVER
ncbi:condensation domain-containing protein [Micromonospora sp. A202]|uniref:condensation domain-containing protein n=1 Tax=Micromonospora sp. A202 TaxID=2572899 RepID=UPI0011543628|nr:condensation domain-containing protein [Micromonospora sp. A202]TQJ23689.1 condensation domain-containing protein [Micromonospora sp. A202]